VFTGAITPTAAERLGDFTADTFKVYMPGTKTQVDGTNSSPNCVVATLNCIPAALLDTTIANLDNVSNTIGSSIPLPNGAVSTRRTGGGAYAGLFPIPTQENEYLGKYDQNLGEKDHVTATYFFSRNVLGNSPGGNVPWTINQNASNGTNINLSDVHTFSPTTANQAWLTFTRAAGGRVNLPLTGPATQTLASYGSNFLIQGPPHCPPSQKPISQRPRPMPVRSRVPTTMNCATWSAWSRANTTSLLAASSLSTRPCSLPTC
jgi:hypothetical protein